MIKLIPWVGSKTPLLWAIQSLLPVHFRKFVDVFGGSGTVTLNLQLPKNCLQIYNDLDHDLYNLLYCTRNKTLALTRELGFLPDNSRDTFDEVCRFLKMEEYGDRDLEEELALAKVLFDKPQAEEISRLLLQRSVPPDVRRAAAYYKMIRYSFNGQGNNYAVASCDIRQFFHQIWEVSRRLKDVVLENRDFESIIKKNKEPQTVLYCDPPYYKAERCYDVEFPRSDHQRLHDVLIVHKGFFMVSYNYCDFIKELYKECFIYYLERPNSQSRKKDSVYEECIITNYDPRVFARQITMYGDFGRDDRVCKLVHIPDHPLKVE